MKKNGSLLFYELRYLLRQKFLICMCILGLLFLAYAVPKFQSFTDFDLLQMKEEDDLNEAEKLILDMWNGKKADVEEERKNLAEEAVRKKESLSATQQYEIEYLSNVQKKYERDLFLEANDYSGWEMFFLHKSGMQPHNPLSLLHVIMIVSGGLLLLAKDRENNTLFWAANTGKGTSVSSFTVKIFATFIYGFFLQLLFSILYILWLWLWGEYDMRYWFYPIQNVPGYGLCDFQFPIFSCILIDIFLKCIVGLIITYFVFLFALFLKRYLFLFIGGSVVSGVLYYIMSVMIEWKNFDMWWRLNPFSVFLLNQTLSYDAVNLFNHAVDARWIVGIVWGIMLMVFLSGSYRIWRRYSNESS